AREGICLVITPLVALMKDQTDQLAARGIASLWLHSALSWREVEDILRQAVDGKTRFLYVSAERLQSGKFRDYLVHMDISLVAVDEAHCISEWGYDFRPAYLKIAELRESLPGTPLLALTATATREVIADICEKLGLKQPRVFRQSFSRPNIAYSAIACRDKQEMIRDLVEKTPGPGLVYCKTRIHAERTASWLSLNQIPAEFYHAGLPAAVRTERQERWIRGETRIMACTSAFGMGIDKPDVRVVIHRDAPQSLESYYQQSGRAGRDGISSRAVLLFEPEEFRRLRTSLEQKYPAPALIRKIYQALSNYLQMPEGSGEMQRFDFDPEPFARTFGINTLDVRHALRILEMDGMIQLSDKMYQPSQAMFLVRGEALGDFEKDHPDAEPLTQCLLRNFPGITDELVAVREGLIARKLYGSSLQIGRRMEDLDRAGILRYLPRSDHPQILFLQDRVPAETLDLDLEGISRRKAADLARLQAMEHYATRRICRNRQLLEYFNEKVLTDCGTCDVCMEKKG
ncbi:MAG TPA: RecQ family ATP-dependent DNA helicase, partial [Chitinophagaceae bacterium]|nr:RecQ family ATP-dependent DNA helicase [Chitinophagaceae bacterium]